MKHWMLGLLPGMLLAGAGVPASAEDAEATVEERLADAQRRLEEAAREVAELSGAAAGPQAFRQLDHFLPGRRRAMLGVNLGAAEPNGGGVRIESVSPGGPAAESGVRAGDVIVAIESKPVTTGRELVRAMSSVEPGDKLRLGLRRDGKPVELTVEARALDRTLVVGAPAVAALPAFPAMPFEGGAHWLLDGWGDAELVTLTPELGRYFGADKGVLVARAPDDASLGLQDGDVIVAIGGREPQSGPHAMRILRSYQPGESVEIRILRDHRTQTVSATVPDRPRHDVLRFATPPHPPHPPAPPPPPRESAAT
jgi:S1-C subfamily serine protease